MSMEPEWLRSGSANAVGLPSAAIASAPPPAPNLRKSRRPTLDARAPSSKCLIIVLPFDSSAAPPNQKLGIAVDPLYKYAPEYVPRPFPLLRADCPLCY